MFLIEILGLSLSGLATDFLICCLPSLQWPACSYRIVFRFWQTSLPGTTMGSPCQEESGGQTTSWDNPPCSLEQALTNQRRHRIDAPLGFDDTGEPWQWYDHHSSQTYKAAPQYSCQVSNGAMQVGQVDLAKLLAKLSQFAATVLLVILLPLDPREMSMGRPVPGVYHGRIHPQYRRVRA